MNRRNFLAAAVAAALAPAALVEGPFENIYFRGTRLVFDSTYTWWRNGDSEYVRGIPRAVSIDDMNRLWKECLNDQRSLPNLIYVDRDVHEFMKELHPEMFA